MKPKALVWLRRDLRLTDHAPLALAEAEGWETALAFVFDTTILKNLPKNDRRIPFFHAALREIDGALRERGTRLCVAHGDPVKEIPALARRLGVKHVIAGRDYESAAIARDEKVERELARDGIELRLLKDQVIFERDEILNGSHAPYRVFSAYKKAWLARLSPTNYDQRGRRLPKLLKVPGQDRWDLKDLGFGEQELWLAPGAKAATKRLKAFSPLANAYGYERDFPALQGTSGLSAHLRFGTVSIRACVRVALANKAHTWLSELVWRDFYFMILSQFPHVGQGHAFRMEHDKIRWPGLDGNFDAWCSGRTGYPLVDAAMRHFNDTGWMHNRLRMVVASFLVKDLLIDWRRGEAYFARGLLDFDLAANNGGWQWCASTGCDAQPYFRIFNPASQEKRFDPNGKFVKTHLPDGTCEPIVDHRKQRERALKLFRK